MGTNCSDFVDTILKTLLVLDNYINTYMDEKIYNQKYLSFKKSPPTKEWCRKVQRSNFAKEMANYEVQGNKTIIENAKYLGEKIQNLYLWQRK